MKNQPYSLINSSKWQNDRITGIEHVSLLTNTNRVSIVDGLNTRSLQIPNQSYSKLDNTWIQDNFCITLKST